MESEVLKRNQLHSTTRNQFYKEEVSKCWKNSISNRQIILRSLARTNAIKNDADEWLGKIDDEALRHQSFEESEDL